MKRLVSFIIMILLLTNVFIIASVANEETVTMYTEDGRTLEVEKPYVEAHENVGWFVGPVVTMYSNDGRTLTVNETKVKLYEDLGWYTEPVTLMYSLDGRMLYVMNSYVEAHKKAGWYTEPVTLMYSLDGRTLVVGKQYVEAHEKVGWYTEPVTVLYSTDGRTNIVKKSEIAINKKVGWFEENELSELRKISRLVIPATVNYTVDAYEYSSLKGYITKVEAGTTVEYMNPDNHDSMKAAKIKLPSGRICWVPMASVSISRKNYTIKDILTNEEREAFVNKNGYKSKTDYLIWVNKQRQTLTLFKGKAGNWKAVYVFPVATGANTTPTPTVVCEYKYKTRWVTDTYICDPVMALYDGYAIHNQPVGHNGYVIDRTIGNPASAGCIRMLLKDVEKLYKVTPVGTTVVLY